MKDKFILPKFLLCIFSVGFFFASCQREEISEEPLIQTSANMEEPEYENYMVIFKDGQSKRSMDNYFSSSDAELVHTMPEIGIAIVNAKDTDFTKSTMKSSGVVSVVPNYQIQWIRNDIGVEATPSIGSTEPYYFFDYLWGMNAINAPQAWNAGYTGNGATVFVLDSGIDAEHFEFSENLNTDLSASFIAGEHWNIRPGVYFNHGTHVAGTIAAGQNGAGVIGVAPHAEIVAVKVLSEYTGSGPFSSINAGIVYAANNGADVINMSLGATLNKNGVLTDAEGNQYKIPAVYVQDIILAQQRAVDYAFKKGTAIIASAGNDGINYDGNRSAIKLPGGLNNVITVSATAPEGYDFTADYEEFDIPAHYTSHGRSLVDVAAPGGDYDIQTPDMIISSSSGNSFFWSAGTSMAAPHVTGVAALIVAKNGGEMDPGELAKQIKSTSDHIDGNGTSVFFGKGRINAFRAVTE